MNDTPTLDTDDRRSCVSSRPAAPALTYRPEIDGLRALAVIPVVFYHAGLALFHGGFVGVDVFFVISGFLITSIIWHDVVNGRFSYAKFYDRRIRRILPAIFVMAVVCIIIGTIILIPVEFGQFGRSLIAMSLFVSNLFFRENVGVAGYFDNAVDPPLVIHTWSLSIEEQFYILFPTLMLLLHRFARRHVTGAIVVAIAVSFACSATLVHARPSDAFYLITSRAWELLIGSLLAVRSFPLLASTPLASKTSAARTLREVVAAAGVVLILLAVFCFTDATPFPGPNALLPCVGAWLIIYAGGQGPSVVSRGLSLAPIVFIGRISYSLYLWHWPVIAATKYLSMGQLSFVKTVAALAISLVAAVLSYRYVETPLRYAWPKMPRRSLFLGAGTATACMVLAGVAISVSGGFPGRFDKSTIALVDANLAIAKDNTGEPLCDNYRRKVSGVADLLTCPIGAGAKKNIFVWGDSHAEELRPVMETLHREGALDGRGAIFAIAPACVPSLTMDRPDRQLHCATIAKYSWERANADDIDTVVIFYTGWRTSKDGDLCRVDGQDCIPLTKQDALSTLASEFADHIRALKAKKKRVVIGLSDPTYSMPLPQYEILKATVPRLTMLKPLSRSDFAETRDRLARVAKEDGALVFDARKSLCTGETCVYEQGGVSIYVDDNHVARSKIGLFHDNLRDVLKQSAAGAP